MRVSLDDTMGRLRKWAGAAIALPTPSPSDCSAHACNTATKCRPRLVWSAVNDTVGARVPAMNDDQEPCRPPSRPARARSA